MANRTPDLNVVDALIAGEGDGPIANQPHWCGCILASEDPVATDISIARLLNQENSKISFKYAAEAERQGLGTRTNIEYVGRQIEEVKIQAWAGHDGFDYLPINFLVGEGVSLGGTTSRNRPDFRENQQKLSTLFQRVAFPPTRPGHQQTLSATVGKVPQ